MLLVHSEFQRLLAFWIQGKQILIVVGAAVQNASLKIDGGINQGMSGAAIFRLDVVGDPGDRHVRVVPEEHFRIRSDLRAGWSKPGRNLAAAFDRVAAQSLL
jgi:hypothetical protein